MKKRISSFVGTAVLTTAIVGALAIGAWFARALLERFLSTPHTFAGVTVTPYGHSMEDLLTHSFDSLKIAVQGHDIHISGLDLEVTLLKKPRSASLKVDSVNAFVQLPEEKKKNKVKKDNSPPAFPEDLRFPIPVQVNVGVAEATLSDGKHWKVKKLEVKSKGEKAASLSVAKAEGDFIKSPASLKVNANFESPKLKADVLVKTQTDSVKVKVDAPKKNLARLKTKAAVSVKNPQMWSPVKFPALLPTIGKINVTADADVDALSGKVKYDATVNTRIGAFWPLMAENATIRINGDLENFDADIKLRNDEGGSIFLNGSFDKNLDGTFKGKVQNMNAKFGPQMMPLDLEIQSAEKVGDIITATIETRRGSIIKGSLDVRDSIYVSYTGDISPYEPWAIDWTHGNLTLTKRTKIYGSCDGHSMKALVKIDSVPYVYHMKADSLELWLDLTTKGITFTDGIIYTPKETFDFYGDVMWEAEDPHTSWYVTQRHGGKASAYITIEDSISIEVNAQKAVIATVPFADISIGEKINGNVTGYWKQNFDSNVGEADVHVEGQLDAFKIQADVVARQNKDTIFIEKANAIHNKNTVQSMATFILPNDSNPEFKKTSFLPIQLLTASVSSREFSIPLLLEPLNDSTLTSGMINGDISYNPEQGLLGNLDFFNVQLRNVDPSIFSIKKLNIYAQGDKVELNSYLDIGGGGWNGNTQVIVDRIFDDNRHYSFSHGSDNGGTIWSEGSFDNDFVVKGTLDANGSWYIPGTLSEIKNTDLHADITADVRKGLHGIVADIRSNKTTYQPPKMNLLIPISLQGHVENGLVDITNISTKNNFGDSITATLQFQLDSAKLQAIDIHSDSYTLQVDEHKVRLANVNSHMEDNENELKITANIPQILYNFEHEMFGRAEALARGDIAFSIPHTKDGLIRNNTISGNITIDKLVYSKFFDIEVSPSSLDKYFTMFNNFIAKLRKKGSVQEQKLSTSSPINLSLHISDSQNDSISIVTPFATFPFTLDVWVLGNTTRPLLRGDITNSDNGFIGVRDIYQFDLNSFQISWNDVPWQNGVIDVTSSQELPYCNETAENEKETCPINLDIQGTITNPQPIPSSNCGTESSSAAIYYNIFLGCIADDAGESTDWNKLAGKAIGKVLSSTANKTLGGDYIGDIDMKVMIFDNTSTGEKDSSYFKVPVSLDRWVKNLSLIFGYTQDQSDNPTYDQALQFGINYTLPVFQEAEYSHQNHLSPALSLNAQLISKQYLTNTGTEGNENRVEKNVGINYTYKFWNPCLLGIGHCEDDSSKKEDSTEPKEDAK